MPSLPNRSFGLVLQKTYTILGKKKKYDYKSRWYTPSQKKTTATKKNVFVYFDLTTLKKMDKCIKEKKNHKNREEFILSPLSNCDSYIIESYYLLTIV